MLFLLSLLATGAAADYLSNAQQGFYGLQGWYNRTSGLWDTCGWWNGANALTAVGGLAAVDSTIMTNATDVFANTYKQGPMYNPQPVNPGDYNSADGLAWCDHCADDGGWWALAWIQAYDTSGNPDYLAVGKSIFDQQTSKAGPSNCSDGGIYWCTFNPYVNAIANELYLSVAAHLANRVGASEKQNYVTLAQDQWAWFQRSGLINSQNLINDGLEYNCTNTGLRTVWTYNMGVILGGLVELNRAAPDSSLIASANTLAQAGIQNLTDSNHILHDVCEPDCEPDAIEFKGIYIRNLVLLQQASPNDLYKTVINANAQSIWDNDRIAANNTFGPVWSGPPTAFQIDAGTTNSALSGLIGPLGIQDC